MVFDVASDRLDATFTVHTRTGYRSPLCWRVLLAAVAMFTLGSGRLESSEGQPKRLLIVYPDNTVSVAALTVGQAVRNRLLQRSPPNVQVYSEFLDRARFPDKTDREIFVRYLSEKYAKINLDLLFAIGPDPLDLILTNREKLAPDAPIVFSMLAPVGSAIKPAQGVTGIVSELDVAQTVSLARQLQPDAQNLVVVAGAAPYDRKWAQITAGQLANHEKQLSARYLLGLTHEALMSELANLSRDTIVVLLSIFKDGSGRDHNADYVQDVTKASSAPVYAPHSTSLGRGIVGGYMDTFEAMGEQTGDLILSHLNGESPMGAMPRLSKTSAFRVDARQLERWNLSERNLPADTIVMFKTPPIWESHRRTVMATAGAFSVMTTMLGLLLFEIIRRRRAESNLSDSEARMEFAAASADVGLWQYDIRKNRLWSSAHCRTMLGLPAHVPLTAQALTDNTHPEDRHVARASVRAATYGKLTDEISEFRIVQPNGETRWLQAKGRTDLDRSGEAVRVSGIFRDITGYKAAQLEAKRLSQQMLNVQDAERQRIAQELHDSTAQHLAAIGLNLTALKGPRHSNDKASRAFDDIETSLHEASKELRAFTYLLHPPALAADGLMATLSRYVAGFERRTGIRVTLRSSNRSDALSQLLQESILRIAQEALANVHRHARASCALVHLRRIGDRLHLIIADNGQGLPAACRKSGRIEQLPTGVGIAGMRARVQQFGGQLEIRNRGIWTIVHGVVPIGNESAATAAECLVGEEQQIAQSSGQSPQMTTGDIATCP